MPRDRMRRFMPHHRGKPILGLGEWENAGIHRHLPPGKCPGVHHLVIIDEDDLPLKTGRDLGMQPICRRRDSIGHANDHLVIPPGVDRLGPNLHLCVRLVTERDFLRHRVGIQLPPIGPCDGLATAQEHRRHHDPAKNAPAIPRPHDAGRASQRNASGIRMG